MRNVEYAVPVSIGEATISAIQVEPLTFTALVTLWGRVSSRGAGTSQVAALQRQRIIKQVHFLNAAKERVTPSEADITQLPIPVARAIIAELDIGEGNAGELLNDADGISAPVHYKLGNPIVMEQNGKKTAISELEFKADIYGDVEDVMAASDEMTQTVELLKRVAKPVDSSLKVLPSWALDRISTADGVTIAKLILPRFLG